MLEQEGAPFFVRMRDFCQVICSAVQTALELQVKVVDLKSTEICAKKDNLLFVSSRQEISARIYKSIILHMKRFAPS